MRFNSKRNCVEKVNHIADKYFWKLESLGIIIIMINLPSFYESHIGTEMCIFDCACEMIHLSYLSYYEHEGM